MNKNIIPKLEIHNQFNDNTYLVTEGLTLEYLKDIKYDNNGKIIINKSIPIDEDTITEDQEWEFEVIKNGKETNITHTTKIKLGPDPHSIKLNIPNGVVGASVSHTIAYPGETITLHAGTIPENRVFNKWNVISNGTNIDVELNLNSMSFIMPDNDVDISMDIKEIQYENLKIFRYPVLPVPTPSQMSIIAFGNGIYVGISPQASIHYSTDKVNWHPALSNDMMLMNNFNSPGNNDWRDVVFADGMFVTIGGGSDLPRIMLSTDGMIWEPPSNFDDNRTQINGSWMNIVYNEKTENFIITGSNMQSRPNIIHNSPNNKKHFHLGFSINEFWPTNFENVFRIELILGRFIIINHRRVWDMLETNHNSRFETIPVGHIHRSEYDEDFLDVIWSRRNPNNPDDTTLTPHNVFYVRHIRGGSWRSLPAVPGIASQAVSQINIDDNYIFAIRSRNLFRISLHDINGVWEPILTDVTSYHILYDTIFIRTTLGLFKISYDNILTDIPEEIDVPLPISTAVDGIKIINGRLVISMLWHGAPIQAILSDDGETLEYTLPEEPENMFLRRLNSTRRIDDKYISNSTNILPFNDGNLSHIFESDNLKEWNNVLFTGNGVNVPPFTRIIHGNGIYVGTNTTTVNRIVATSIEEPYIFRSVTPAGFTNVNITLAFGNGLFVGTVENQIDNRIIVSNDAINWDVINVDFQLNRIFFGNGLFISTFLNTIHVSTDGKNWTQSNNPSNFNNPAFGFLKDRIMMINQDHTRRVFLSEDGIDWVESNQRPITGTMFNNTKLQDDGNGGVIIYGAQNLITRDGIVWSLVRPNYNGIFSNNISQSTQFIHNNMVISIPNSSVRNIGQVVQAMTLV